MSRIEFESTRVRDQKRLEQQQARKLMLEKVRTQHERVQQEKVSAIQRGETTWVLPSVDAAIAKQSGADVGNKGKKHNKKDKKHKKKKKKKSKKRDSSTSGNSSEEDDEWVEKCAPASQSAKPAPPAVTVAPDSSDTPQQSQQQEEPAKREEWMEMSSLFGTFSRNEMRLKEGNSRVVEKIKQKNKQPDKPGSSAMELNPYYRDGGSGLPGAASNNSNNGASEGKVVAPSGFTAEYLRKALVRAKQQAEDDNTTLEEIAVNRWGSLETFYSIMRDAETRERETQQAARRMVQPSNSSRREQNQHRNYNRNDNHMEDKLIKFSDCHIEDKSTDRPHRGDRRSRTRSRSGDRRTEYLSKRKSKVNKSRSRSRSKDRKQSNHKSERKSRSRSTDRSRYRRSQSNERSNNSRRKRRRKSSRSSSSGSSSNSSSSSDRSSSRKRKSDNKRSSRRSNSEERRDRYHSTSAHHDRSEQPQSQRGRARRSPTPELKTRRLLKPGESLQENKELSDNPDSRNDFAVWDKPRAVAAKRSSTASSGGWRKKPEEEHKREERSKRSAHQGGEGRNKHGDRRRHRSSSSSSGSGGSSSEHSNSDDEQKNTKNTHISELTQEKHGMEEPNKSSCQSKGNIEEKSSTKPLKILTEHELNQLGAKIVKAELMGNQALADKLKKKLDKARKESQEAIKLGLNREDGDQSAKTEEVLLTTTNARGFTRPVASIDPEAPGTSGGKKSRRRAKVSSVGADGERDKYFPDDNRFDLKQMFEKEKLSGTSDADAMFVRAAARCNKATLDDDYTLDDSFVDKSAVREDTAGQDSRDRMKAIMEHQQREKVLSSCRHCFDSSQMQKHLLVSLGSKSYVSLPHHQSLVDGHCLIVPRDHLATSTLLDEDTWQEMKNYRCSLVRYFESRGEDVLFLECCMKLNSHPHTVLHCIPLPKEMGDLAPIYYKKAIQESESEWCQNVKLVDLSGRDVRRAIPKGFPYFAVDFGSMPGYAHVIEDEQTFPSYFGTSVVGGMLDLEPQLWRKPRPEKFDEQRRKVLAFANNFEKFDTSSQN